MRNTDRVDELQELVDELETEVGDLGAQVDELKAELSVLQAQFDKWVVQGFTIKEWWDGTTVSALVTIRTNLWTDATQVILANPTTGALIDQYEFSAFQYYNVWNGNGANGWDDIYDNGDPIYGTFAPWVVSAE
jgi:hypothetical protein